MTRTSLYIRMINYNSIQCLPKRYYQLNMAFNTEITSFLRILTNRCEIKQKKKGFRSPIPGEEVSLEKLSRECALVVLLLLLVVT